MSLPIDHEKRILELLQQLRAEQSELNLVNSEVTSWNVRQKPTKELYDKYQVQRAETEAIYTQYRALNDAMSQEGESLNKQIVEARSKIQNTQTLMLDTFIEWMIRQ